MNDARPRDRSALTHASARREPVRSRDEAITSAEQSRDEAGLAGAQFQAGDATAFALSAQSAPDLVIVNPPRRGVRAGLAG